MGAESEAKAARSVPWRAVGVVAVLVLLLVAYKFYGAQIDEAMKAARDGIERTGRWAPVVFIAVYIVGTVACFPGSVLTLGAGAIFGPVWGLVYVSFASTTGATCSFLMGRYFARGPISGWLEGKEKFQKLDELTRAHGSYIVAVTRLIPLFPFTLLNYGFGLTRVPLLTYVWCSWLFMLPGTAAYILVGAGAAQAAEKKQFPWGIFIALLTVAIVLFLIGHFGRSFVKRKMRIGDDEEERDEQQ
ncbi:MAG: TVP38/TMEM64 family protein [Candidatus Brocadiia bacterium]|nr:TVP38/TMEM64 family protein [Candidatus Brocadiia bacterium]